MEVRSTPPVITAPRPAGTISVNVVCPEGDWPNRSWLDEDDSIRIRQVHAPYDELASSQCHVVLLRSHNPAHDLPRLRRAMGGRALPALLVCPVADTEQITAAFGLGATSYLVDWDYGKWMLTNAIWSTAVGHTALSPVAAAALMRGVSARPGPAADAGASLPQSLSRRERQVMDLLSLGCKVTEIGQRLSLTVKTVRNYLSRIYAKLGVDGRTEAVLLWLGARRHRAPADTTTPRTGSRREPR